MGITPVKKEHPLYQAQQRIAELEAAFHGLEDRLKRREELLERRSKMMPYEAQVIVSYYMEECRNIVREVIRPALKGKEGRDE